MKKLLVAALICAAALLGAAEKNLLPGKWRIYGKNSAAQSTVIQKNGQIDCSIPKIAKGQTGVSVALNFKTPLKGSIVFGAESKAENARGKVKENYCVYIDVIYVDNTKSYAHTALFTPGTHNWEKKTATLKLKKPVKELRYYLLFRNMTGKASFRNVFLYNK